MGTLKHSLQRRNHRERAQPVERQKWGFLEKAKDYRLRAQDYQSKQRRLKRLREKAEQRNPDEFYFGMLKEKTKDGIVSVDRGNLPLSEETVRLLKTQDAAYIKTMLHIENKKVKKLEEHVHTSTYAVSDRIGKYYFVDEKELENKEKIYQKKKIDPANQIQKTSQEKLLAHDHLIEMNLDQINDSRNIQPSSKVTLSVDSNVIRELELRKNRVAKLSMLAKHIDLQRNLQTKGERKKVGISNDGISIYRWKLERKR